MEISSITILITCVIFLVALYITHKLSTLKANLKFRSELNKIRREIAEKQRVGIKGRVSETFAPFLEGFPFKPSECKFIGDPVDYLVFEGLDERDVKKIHLVEIKSGNSKLSKHQKQIQDLIDSIDSENITFREFRFEN
jgi:predicted Holliday junction resolvase-like endonuclease